MKISFEMPTLLGDNGKPSLFLLKDVSNERIREFRRSIFVQDGSLVAEIIFTTNDHMSNSIELHVYHYGKTIKSICGERAFLISNESFLTNKPIDIQEIFIGEKIVTIKAIPVFVEKNKNKIQFEIHICRLEYSQEV